MNYFLLNKIYIFVTIAVIMPINGYIAHENPMLGLLLIAMQLGWIKKVADIAGE